MIRLVSSLFHRGKGIPEKPGFTGAALREQGSGIQPDAGGPSVASGSDRTLVANNDLWRISRLWP